MWSVNNLSRIFIYLFIFYHQKTLKKDVSDQKTFLNVCTVWCATVKGSNEESHWCINKDYGCSWTPCNIQDHFQIDIIKLPRKKWSIWKSHSRLTVVHQADDPEFYSLWKGNGEKVLQRIVPRCPWDQRTLDNSTWHHFLCSSPTAGGIINLSASNVETPFQQELKRTRY